MICNKVAVVRFVGMRFMNPLDVCMCVCTTTLRLFESLSLVQISSGFDWSRKNQKPTEEFERVVVTLESDGT